MSGKIIVFGDSWAAGECTDLVEEGLVPRESNDIHLNPAVNSLTFKTPWPTLLGEKLNTQVLNYAIPGNCNKGIITQLYDYQLFKKFNKDDIVIVSFSTWHREYVWQTYGCFYNFLFLGKSSSFYAPKTLQHLKDRNDSLSDLDKLAYDAFFDFYTAKQFLENLRLKFYIGWAFTEISDFSQFLLKEYIDDIYGTKNLIDPFIKFCKSLNYNKLMHPLLRDHHRYSEYLYKKILKDELQK